MPTSPNARGVFLDKDGTLIENVPYNVDPALIRLAPGAAEALPRLHAAGYRLVIISNQSGVARGYFEEPALEGVARRVGELLEALGAGIGGVDVERVVLQQAAERVVNVFLVVDDEDFLAGGHEGEVG